MLNSGASCAAGPPQSCRGRVSVVVPAWNAERWIGQTLESVLAQDYRDIEVVVVDDGSADLTAAVVQRYGARDSRVRYVRQPNRGPGAARNRGIAEAGGEFVSFIDADDLWASDKLSLQVAELGARRGAVVLCAIQRFQDTEQGREWLHRTDVPELGEKADALGRVAFFESTQMALFTTALFRTRELIALGGWDEELRTGEDWELGLRVVRALSVAVVEQPLYLYRKHSASITRQSNLQEVVRVHLALLEREELKGDLPPAVLVAARRNKLLAFAQAAQRQGDYRLAGKLLATGWLGHGGVFSRSYYETSARLVVELLRSRSVL